MKKTIIRELFFLSRLKKSYK